MRIASRLTQFAAAVAVTLGCMASHASAAVVVYTDRASYEANTVQTGYDKYADLTVDSAYESPFSRSAGSFGYQTTVIDPQGLPPGEGGTLAYGVDNGAGGAWLGTNFATSYLQFSGFSAPVRAIGGSFFATDFDGLPLASAITFKLTDAGGSVFDYVLASGTQTGFLAFVSDSLIQSLAVQSDQSLVDHFITAGELTVGTIPEPGSILLLGLGAVALIGSRRARRA